ncbi:MAG: CoA transferase [Anaerolineaceae bacterium]|nr:MAG: CoA transferase [Anaerolineaceae bacterium]
MSHPLAGIKVLDLTRLLPGAVCSMMLADMGADVIKVEDPNGGDYARWMPPQIDDQSVFFRMNNRNKRSVIINLKNTEGQAVFHRLVASADVVLEGFRPDVLRRLNCDYEALKAANPAIVLCSLSGWGADGPYAALGGHDLNYTALAGIIGAMATPQVLGGQIADIGGAYAGLSGMLAALFRRERTGEGAHVDISLAESALPFALYNWVEGVSMGTAPGEGGLTGGLAYYRVYLAADGSAVSIGALEEKFWLNFCNAVGRPDLVTLHGQIDKQAELRDELAALFAQKTAAEWEAQLADADCCFMRARPPAAIHTDPHLIARGLLGVFDDGTPWMRSPIRISESDPHISDDVPGYGADTDAVLAEFGYESDEIDALRSAGAVR